MEKQLYALIPMAAVALFAIVVGLIAYFQDRRSKHHPQKP